MKSPRRLCILVALGLLATATSCLDKKDSLVIVTAKAVDGKFTGLARLMVSCAGEEKTYDIPAGTDLTAGVSAGLYLDSDLGGNQVVTATASGTANCNGYSGSESFTVQKGGTTSVTVTMQAAQACPADGGATGSGGAGGRVGGGGIGIGGAGAMGGAGAVGAGGALGCSSDAQPPAGTPPALGCCFEYDQDTPENCDPDNGTQVDAVAFSPDGKTFVSAATTAGVSEDVKVWTFDGHLLHDTGTVLDSDGFLSLAFSPDGSLLAIAVTDGVDLWNTRDWSYNTELVGDSNSFKGVAFTPDGTHVIAIDEDDAETTGHLYVFGLSGAPQTVLNLTDDPETLAVAPKLVSGKLGVVVTYSDGLVDIFSMASNYTFTTPDNVNAEPNDPGFPAWSATFSPDTSLIAVGNDDAEIHFWAYPPTGAESGNLISFSKDDDAVYALAFSPNGTYLAAGGGAADTDSHLATFTVATRAALKTVTSSHDVTAVAFSPAGNAIGGGELNCGKVFICTN